MATYHVILKEIVYYHIDVEAESEAAADAEAEAAFVNGSDEDPRISTVPGERVCWSIEKVTKP